MFPDFQKILLLTYYLLYYLLFIIFIIYIYYLLFIIDLFFAPPGQTGQRGPTKSKQLGTRSINLSHILHRDVGNKP